MNIFKIKHTVYRAIEHHKYHQTIQGIIKCVGSTGIGYTL